MNGFPVFFADGTWWYIDNNTITIWTNLFYHHKVVQILGQLENARKQLLPAMAWWPRATHITYWLYALHKAVYLCNILLTLVHKMPRLEKFAKINVGFHWHQFHTFRCPIYTLYSTLAAGKLIQKWFCRAWIGLNWGLTLFHARNVRLVFNLSIRLVLLKYYCKYNDFLRQ